MGSLHWKGVHPWPYPHRCGGQAVDEQTAVIRRDYLHYVKKYNRFEETQEHVCPHLALLQRHCHRRHPHCRRVQAPEQDCEVQHPEGVQVCPLQEGLLQVLTCSRRRCTASLKIKLGPW